MTEGSITLEVFGEGERVSGWKYLWLKYVWGFAPSVHCAVCLRGRYSAQVRRDMPFGAVALNESRSFDVAYLCGIPLKGRKYHDNLHMPLLYAPGKTCEQRAVTGQVFRAYNAQRLPIPPLARGFDERPREFTDCRNWQFGVSRYGLVPKPRQPAPPD